jgi:hypothetical protein
MSGLFESKVEVEKSYAQNKPTGEKKSGKAEEGAQWPACGVCAQDANTAMPEIHRYRAK